MQERSWKFPESYEGDPLPIGPWTREPDKLQWPDAATGLPCLIVRNGSGALCGYVGVAPGHPLHGVEYGDCARKPPCDERYCVHSPDGVLTVHGGITFSDNCNPAGGEAHGVCHVPDAGEPAHLWWIGFDCAHSGDLVPGMPSSMMWADGWYKDVDYVRAECARLAQQIAAWK